MLAPFTTRAPLNCHASAVESQRQRRRTGQYVRSDLNDGKHVQHVDIANARELVHTESIGSQGKHAQHSAKLTVQRPQEVVLDPLQNYSVRCSHRMYAAMQHTAESDSR